VSTAQLPKISADSFGGFVRSAAAAGQLVVQPRMGMSAPAAMRAGLQATREARAVTIGTITLDSYTRVGDHGSVTEALRDGIDLNGYPIVHYAGQTNAELLADLHSPSFPIQVRHGSAAPGAIFAAIGEAGLSASEGGPVSYCLPYGRTPLAASVRHWEAACESFVEAAAGRSPHLETFGGCMMGQLCPPSLLVALSVLEAMFFVQHGIRSVSLSYSQQTHAMQDQHALTALRRLAGELLVDIDWHLVLYTYMGVYPTSPEGASILLEESARLAVRAGVERLIVKTVAEAHRIPTVAENVLALETASAAAQDERMISGGSLDDDEIYAEARDLISAVLNCGSDLGSALKTAFRQGYLDVPYCLHPDNAGRSRSYLDVDGQLRWATTGAMPLPGRRGSRGTDRLSSTNLLSWLTYVGRKFDSIAVAAKIARYSIAGPHRPVSATLSGTSPAN
jgi:methylaspartate mutase epsilon subunit